MSPASNELPGFFICHTIYIFAEKDKATMSKYLSILFLVFQPGYGRGRIIVFVSI